MNVTVLHDAAAPTGRPDEQDGMVQVRWVCAQLERARHSVRTLPVSLDLESARAAILGAPLDLVFNLVEALAGDGRLIHMVPSLLDALSVPYTGCPAGAVFLTSSKVLAKRWLRAHGLPTPATAESFRAGRYIIKPVWEDASVGIDDTSVVDCASALELSALVNARSRALGHECFAEAFIDGREFNLSILEIDGKPTVLPAAEIVFDAYPADKPRLVGYAAKWDEGSFEYTHTVRRFDFPQSDRTLVERLHALCLDAWHAFELRGYARVDFRVSENAEPLILEVNVNPCLSPDAGFAAAAARAGIDAAGIVYHILAAAQRVADR